MTEPEPALRRRRRWLVAIAAATVVVVGIGVTVLVAAADRESEDAEPQTGGTGEHPLALVSVLDAESDAEEPPADLWLVEIGQPIDKGILLVEDSGFAFIETPDSSPSWNPRSLTSPGVVDLPDGRLLIAYTLQQDEYVRNTGAVVVDAQTREVATVYHEEDGFDAGARWDPTARTLTTGNRPAGSNQSCLRWAPEASPSGFVESTDCPPIPTPDVLGDAYATDHEVAAIWDHGNTGTRFVATMLDRPLQSQLRLHRIEPGSSEPTVVADEASRLMAVSSDASVVVFSRRPGCGAGPCPEVLVVASGSGPRDIASDDVVTSAFVIDDAGDVLIYSLRSLDPRPYEDDTYLVDLDGDREPEHLYDASVEAIVGTDSGLALLTECPPDLDCAAAG